MQTNYTLARLCPWLPWGIIIKFWAWKFVPILSTSSCFSYRTVAPARFHFQEVLCINSGILLWDCKGDSRGSWLHVTTHKGCVLAFWLQTQGLRIKNCSCLSFNTTLQDSKLKMSRCLLDFGGNNFFCVWGAMPPPFPVHTHLFTCKGVTRTKRFLFRFISWLLKNQQDEAFVEELETAVGPLNIGD